MDDFHAGEYVKARLDGRKDIDSEIALLESKLKEAKKRADNYNMETVMRFSGMSVIEHRKAGAIASSNYAGEGQPHRNLYHFCLVPEEICGGFRLESIDLDADTKGIFQTPGIRREPHYLGTTDTLLERIESGEYEVMDSREAVRRAMEEIEPLYNASVVQFNDAVASMRGGCVNNDPLPELPKRPTREKVSLYAAMNLPGHVLRAKYNGGYYSSPYSMYIKVNEVKVQEPVKYHNQYHYFTLVGTAVYSDAFGFWMPAHNSVEISINEAVATRDPDTGKVSFGGNGEHCVTELSWEEFDKDIGSLKKCGAAMHDKFIHRLNLIATGSVAQLQQEFK